MGAASGKQMAGCTGKAAFKTRRVAQRQATWMQRRWRSEKRRRLFDVYQCKSAVIGTSETKNHD